MHRDRLCRKTRGIGTRSKRHQAQNNKQNEKSWKFAQNAFTSVISDNTANAALIILKHKKIKLVSANSTILKAPAGRLVKP